MRMRLIGVSCLIVLAAPASGTTLGSDRSSAIAVQQVHGNAPAPAREATLDVRAQPAVMRAYAWRPWQPPQRRFRNDDRRHEGYPRYRSYSDFHRGYRYSWRRPYGYGGFYYDQAPWRTERYRWSDRPYTERRSRSGQRWVRGAPDVRYWR